MGREFELKFEATASILAQVAADLGPFREIAMETTYLDTPDGALARQHITLRRRMENGQSVCTVKTPLADGSRGEWEIFHRDLDTIIPALLAAGAPTLLADLTKSGIAPLCGARFTRRAATVEADDWAVELALDSGVLMGGGREIPLCELEVELKEGPDEAALVFAKSLAEKYGLKPQLKSKFKRAQELTE